MSNLNEQMGTLVVPAPYSRHPLGAITDSLGLKGLFPDKAVMKPIVLELSKRCPDCGGPCVRSRCEFCLKKTADKWNKRAEERRAAGLCCKCTLKAVLLNGKVSSFCRKHRAENKAKAKAWTQANGKNRWVKRKTLGVCVNSPTHGPVEKPHAYCSGCRQRLRRHRREKPESYR